MIARIHQPLRQTFVRISCLNYPRGFRTLSTAAATTYPSFPASLLRYNSRNKSTLYDRSERDQREDDPNWDGIMISGDGLVHPGVSKDPTTYKGAMLMPNTFTMQEIIRAEIDHYIDNEENGKHVEVPFVYCIRKGTPVPSTLLLVREGLSRFSLQPSEPMRIEKFNGVLDAFYESHGERTAAEQWLDDNPFESAVGDDADSVWMER